MDKCGGCGADMKTVPPGIAKATGKPYGAFMACSNKCGWKPPRTTAFNVPSTHQAPPPQPAVNPFQDAMDTKDKMIRHAQERKDESIAKSRSISGAYTIVAALITSGLVQEADIKSKVREYTAYLFSIEIDLNTGVVTDKEIF
jgi:hypothetical protein